MNDQVVVNFYDIYDSVFPTSGITDLTDVIYEKPETTYEQAQLNQSNWLLNQVECGPNSVILDVGCGYGPLLEETEKRGAKAIGISLSEKQVKFCLKKGLNVLLLNYKNIGNQWDDKFDGIVANGSLEHFVKPEEADIADEIYRDFFRICHQLINPRSISRRLATTAIHFSRFYPRDPLDLTKSPFTFPLFSENFHAAIIQRAMVGFMPNVGQLESCAKPFFRLINEVDGTEDYRRTSEEWLRRVRRSYLNPIKIPGIILRLAPFLAQYPVHTITAISFAITESWNKMFRGQDPSMKLLRQIWEYQ